MSIDGKEVEQKEPLHPEAREEMRKRMALVDAIREEVELMKEVSEYTKSPAEKVCAALIANALRHILVRWVDGDQVKLDRANWQFQRVERKS